MNWPAGASWLWLALVLAGVAGGATATATVATAATTISAAPVRESYVPFETTGEVISNHDGDTFKLQTPDQGVLTVRFSGMDTPETGQAYWKSARRALSGLVRGQPVTVHCYKKSHDRDVCRVFAGTGNRVLDVGLEMVKAGMAWHAFQFVREQTEAERVAYTEAETRARHAKVGLWAESDPMPPWECRKLRKAGQKCR